MSNLISFSDQRRETWRQTPLTDAEIAAVAPSVFAARPHPKCSDRYAFIPTLTVLNALRAEGLAPFMVAQTLTRDAEGMVFAKHMLRLRREHEIAEQEAHEVVLLNSHCTGAAMQLLSGVLRFVCANGMVVGDLQENLLIRHAGDVVGAVVDGAYRVIEGFERTREDIARMKAITLTEREQLAFAETALPLRFEEGVARITAAEANTPQRPEDIGDSLWLTLQRTQEALIRGGRVVRDRRERRRTTRPVTAIDTNVRVNRALWTLAQRTALRHAA